MSEFLTLDGVEKICFEYAKTKLAHDEPVPAFDTRYPGVLEAVLAAPQQRFDQEHLYPTLERQAAVLFYELNKRHPFLNGNKRIATVSLTVFLALNGRWLKTDWRELYDIAVTVAESSQQRREGVLRLLEEFIRNKSEPL